MSQQHITTLLREIEADCLDTSRYTGIDAFNPDVMKAIARVPREEFVPDHLKPWAYENNPLPIGDGQTISQPFIVALMTDLLCPSKNHIILELGTGSGYQAAVLAQLVKKVYSIEIVPSLALRAERLLQKLHYNNVQIQLGDASLGWPEHAPFDGIIVTAAVDHIPLVLKEQLRSGGRLVIPVGHPHMSQQLLLVQKDATGRCTQRDILPVAFVPFTGQLNGTRNTE